jgi:hypothetical protein
VRSESRYLYYTSIYIIDGVRVCMYLCMCRLLWRNVYPFFTFGGSHTPVLCRAIVRILGIPLPDVRVFMVDCGIRGDVLRTCYWSGLVCSDVLRDPGLDCVSRTFSMRGRVFALAWPRSHSPPPPPGYLRCGVIV